MQADVSGGTLTVSAPLTNSGTLAATDSGILTLSGAWSNTGSLTINGGTLNLGSSFTTADVETVNYTAGTVNLTGTLDNTGDTLTLGSNTGVWTLNGGTILGGVIAGSGGPWLSLAYGTLDGVTLNTDAALTASGYPTVKNGLTLNSTITASSNIARLCFQGSQSLTGTGEIVLSSAGRVCVEGADSETPATLTVGPGITIRGYGSITGTYSGDSLVNEATLLGNVSDRALTVSLPLVNHGTVATSGSGNLTIGDLVNTGTVRQAGSGTVTVENLVNTGLVQAGSSVSDTGTVTVTGSWSNEGTFLVMGEAVFTRGGTSIQGEKATVSGTELLLTWSGLLVDQIGTTYSTETSSDGVNYTASDAVTADDTMFVATCLQPNSAYHVRVVAEYASGGTEIYDSGSISTCDAPDRSGWYQVSSVTRDSDG